MLGERVDFFKGLALSGSSAVGHTFRSMSGAKLNWVGVQARLWAKCDQNEIKILKELIQKELK